MPTTYLASATRTARFLGRCDHCIRPIGIENEAEMRDIYYVACPDCGTRSKVERLYGTVNRMRCDGRCMGAIGPICDCACGGANHGNRFFQTGEALISAIQAYRVTTERRRAAATQRAATRRANRAAAIAQENEAYRLENAGILRDLANYSGDNSFLNSLRVQGIENGVRLSARQLEAGAAALERAERYEAERAARQAQEADNVRPAPLGSGIAVEGIVLSVRSQEGQYGTEWKMLLKCDGFKVWSTIPRTLIDAAQEIQRTSGGHWDSVLVGKRIIMKANLVAPRENNDPTFAIAKRPRDARIINENINAEASALDPMEVR